MAREKLTASIRETLDAIRKINDRQRGLGALFHPGHEDELRLLKADGYIISRLNGYFITDAGRQALAEETRDG